MGGVNRFTVPPHRMSYWELAGMIMRLKLGDMLVTGSRVKNYFKRYSNETKF